MKNKRDRLFFTQLFVPQASQSSYDRRAELDVRLAIPSAQSACGMEMIMEEKDTELRDEGLRGNEKIEEAMKVNSRHVSVDAPFAEGEDNSLLDVLPNNDSPMADKKLVMESLREEINRALQTLNERERNIIEAFFGINQQEMTLEEIGDKYGLTRERVRQIKEKAIRRLRHNTKNKLLKSYLGQ